MLWYWLYIAKESKKFKNISELLINLEYSVTFHNILKFSKIQKDKTKFLEYSKIQELFRNILSILEHSIILSYEILCNIPEHFMTRVNSLRYSRRVYYIVIYY